MPRLALNSSSSCHSLLRGGIAGACLHSIALSQLPVFPELKVRVFNVVTSIHFILIMNILLVE